MIQQFHKKIRGWQTITIIEVFQMDSNITRRRTSNNRTFHQNQDPIVELKPIAILKTFPLRNNRQNTGRRLHEELLKNENNKQKEKGRKE